MIVTCLFKETIMKKLQKSVDSGHLEYNKSSISVTSRDQISQMIWIDVISKYPKKHDFPKRQKNDQTGFFVLPNHESIRIFCQFF